ncbi:MAG: hypothetical protein AAGB32_03010, partial [Pseudomonadota bacterium]
VNRLYDPAKKFIKDKIIEPTKRFSKAVVDYFNNLDNIFIRYAKVGLKATGVALKFLVLTAPKAIAFGVTWPVKTYFLNPINKALDVAINQLEKKYQSKALSVANELKEHLSEELKTAWKKARSEEMDATTLMAVNSALDFSNTGIIESSSKPEHRFETPLTVDPMTRSFIQGMEREKRTLNISLKADFVELFTHDKMEAAKKIDVVDVVRKATSNFMVERGYAKRHLDVAVHVTGTTNKQERDPNAPPITMFDHLLEDNKGIQERRPSSLDQAS